jgi:hypothetical protein
MVFGGNYPFGAGMTSMHFMPGTKLYGSTVNCNEIFYHDEGPGDTVYIQDCIMHHRETSGPTPPDWLHFTTRYSVFAPSFIAFKNQQVWPDSGKPADSATCQFNDSVVIVPSWLAPKDSFNLDSALKGVTTPPIPGTPPYTDYATDLWGNPRYTIGANWQQIKLIGVTKDVSTGPVGTFITFTGSGFAAPCWVKFGSDSSALTVNSYTDASGTVPLGLAPGVYAVTVGNGDLDQASVGNFIVTAPSSTRRCGRGFDLWLGL